MSPFYFKKMRVGVIHSSLLLKIQKQNRLLLQHCHNMKNHIEHDLELSRYFLFFTRSTILNLTCVDTDSAINFHILR